MDRGSPSISSGPTRAQRSLREVLAAFLAAVLLVAMPQLAGPASAHTYLLSSDPADGATVGVVPEQVMLEFTEQVELEFANVTVSVSGGPAYGALTEAEGKTLVVRIPPGVAAGQPESGPALWKIAYRVTANDGHPVNEAFSFTVTPGSGAAAGAQEPIAASGNSVDSEVWASDVRSQQAPGGVLLILGVLTAATVLIAVTTLRRRARRA
ncbi:copper resistance CopC family protein [Arthrobacter sp. H41]|uniref:copper resistance CopC family protein n=1 Tax=Arthrobacter sp. H41 TaxID=1312978 RepID=UPI0004791F51|nr:copper resistance CopC family protein [Arthrobacter sp. H41]